MDQIISMDTTSENCIYYHGNVQWNRTVVVRRSLLESCPSSCLSIESKDSQFRERCKRES